MPLVYVGKGEDEPITDAHERARKMKPQYTRGDLVRVAGGRNLAEAELIQGILLEEGIPSMQERTAAASTSPTSSPPARATSSSRSPPPLEAARERSTGRRDRADRGRRNRQTEPLRLAALAACRPGCGDPDRLALIWPELGSPRAQTLGSTRVHGTGVHSVRATRRSRRRETRATRALRCAALGEISRR